MPIRAQLFIGDQKYKLKGCSFFFTRSTSIKGYPTSHVIGGRIICILSFPSDSSIFKMMVAGNELEGTVLFKNSLNGELIKRLHFKRACLANFEETLGIEERLIKFSLSFQELRVGKAFYNPKPNNN